MNHIKRPFLLSVRKQWAVFLLALILLGLQGVIYLFQSDPSDTMVTNESNYYQTLLDSIRLQTIKKGNKIYPFNPNYLSDYRAYQLGISPEAIDRLFAYRKQGKFVNSANEFQKVTGINDSLLKGLSPYFKFPSWVIKNKEKKFNKTKKAPKKDINTARVIDFQSVRGIGETLSARIIKFRNHLHGFSSLEQCYEIYGLDSLVVKRLLDRFEIQSLPKIEKKSMNTISLKELQELPYINNEDARKIISLRTQLGLLTAEDLREIFKDYPKKINRIMLYLF